jgi:hypothetical protein
VYGENKALLVNPHDIYACRNIIKLTVFFINPASLMNKMLDIKCGLIADMMNIC